MAQTVEATVASGIQCAKQDDLVGMATFANISYNFTSLKKLSDDSARNNLIGEIPKTSFADSTANLQQGLQLV